MESGVDIDCLKWKAMSNCLTHYDKSQSATEKDTSPNDGIRSVFANSRGEEEIYPPMIPEIADAQRADKVSHKMFKRKLDKTLSQQYIVTEIFKYILWFLGGISGFSILPLTKILPQATRPHEPSTRNCDYS